MGESDSIIKTVAENCKQQPICYVPDYDAGKAGLTNATEEEMKMWLIDRGNRNLITYMGLAAGWEDGTVIVIDDSNGRSVDNMCLRTVSSLHFIKYWDIKTLARNQTNPIFFMTSHEKD